MRVRVGTVAGLLVLVVFAGCFGPRVVKVDHGSQTPSAGTSSTLLPGPNEDPIPSLRLLDASGRPTSHVFAGENITLSANGSHDPDGRIVRYTWRLGSGGSGPAVDFSGPEVSVRMETPGERGVVLYVEDDRGAVTYATGFFSVHDHRVATVQLVVPPPLPVGGMVFEANLSLPVLPGALLLSLNATFQEDTVSRIQLQIRAPNGTVINRSESARSPAWSIALPVPGTTGNFTAQARLASGLALEARLEFVAWYGYNF